MTEIFYIASIAFQLAGAVLLIIKYWFGSAKRQLLKIQEKRTRVKNGTIILGESIPNDCEFIDELWSSRIAFLYVAAGYIIAIWGSSTDLDKWNASFWVVFMAVILVILGKFISYKIGMSFKDGVNSNKN